MFASVSLKNQHVITYNTMTSRKFITLLSCIKNIRRFSTGAFDVKDSVGKVYSGRGTIREAGGVMGKATAAKEEEYFYNKQKEQLKKLKGDLVPEASLQEEQIRKHEVPPVDRQERRIQ